MTDRHVWGKKCHECQPGIQMTESVCPGAKVRSTGMGINKGLPIIPLSIWYSWGYLFPTPNTHPTYPTHPKTPILNMGLFPNALS